jgi:hypothetical protein
VLPRHALADGIERVDRMAAKQPAKASDLHAILSGVIAMERNLSAQHQGIGLDIVIDGLTSRHA